MGINKVEYGEEVLMDLTSDTVTENDVLQGVTFHGSDGEEKTGKVVVAEVIDNLTSTSTEDALSANQGRILSKSMIIPITQAEYDALSEAEKNSGIYDITDAPDASIVMSADMVGYDNEGTNLSSDNVQNAITELDANIKTVNDEKANQSDVYGSEGYKDSTPYTIGRYCIHKGKLWRCKVACSGVEPTEGTYWTEVSLASLDNNIKWKLVGTATSTKNLSLPSEWNELCVYVAHNANVGGTLIIPKQLLSLKSYFSQVDWVDINGLPTVKPAFFRVSFSGNVISLYNSLLSGEDDKSIAVAYVYYR